MNKFCTIRKNKMRIFTFEIILLVVTSCASQVPVNIELLYQARQFDKVVEEGKKKLKAKPNDIIANHLVGRALADIKKFEEAEQFLKKAITEASPNYVNSWSYAYLGLCNYLNDKYDESKINLEQAIKLNATKNSTNFAKRRLQWFQMTEYFDNWEIVETEHLRFHFQPNYKIESIEKYCEIRENAYIQNNEFFKATPFKKIDYFIWCEPEGAKEIVGKELGFANSDLCIINSKLNQTIGHEITHILSEYGVRPILKNRLVNEGVSVAFDLTNRNRIELAKSVNIKNFTIKELIEQADNLPDSILYPIGGALIEHLKLEKDDIKLKKLIKEQSWQNLIKLYGIEKIEKFEELIEN